MQTYSNLAERFPEKFLWSCDAGIIDGEQCADVLVYDSEEDLEADDDNRLAIHRETVINDK